MVLRPNGYKGKGRVNMHKIDYVVSESVEKDEGLDRIYHPAIDLIYFLREDSKDGLTYTFFKATINFPYFIVINDGMSFYEGFEILKSLKIINAKEIKNRNLKVFKVESDGDLKTLMPYILFSITNGCYGLVCDCQQSSLYKIITYSMGYGSHFQECFELDPEATIYLLSDVGIRIYTNTTDLSDTNSLNHLLNETYNNN